MTTLFLIHGGLWEDVDAGRFWRVPGVVSALESRGFGVLAPDRKRHASGWQHDADYLVSMLPERPVTVVAASNGCSVAVRLALRCPERVDRVVLAWPATAADPKIDEWTRRRLIELGATERIITDLLSGGVLRGVSDAELAHLSMPVGLLPPDPENPFHQRRTVDAVKRLLPNAEELPGFTEPPRPEFAAQSQARSFAGVIAGFVIGGDAESNEDTT